MKRTRNDPFTDYTKIDFEHFKVIQYIKDSYWKCECNCGNEFTSRGYRLKHRKGCQSCTASRVTSARSPFDHYAYIRRLQKDYIWGAKKRELSFELSLEKFRELLLGDCAYCGAPPAFNGNGLQYMVNTTEPLKRNGINRIDTKKGYTIENTVSCCTSCNYAKHEMTLNDFKEWITKVYKNLIEEPSTTIPEGSTLQANGSGNGSQPEMVDDIV